MPPPPPRVTSSRPRSSRHLTALRKMHAITVLRYIGTSPTRRSPRRCTISIGTVKSRSPAPTKRSIASYPGPRPALPPVTEPRFSMQCCELFRDELHDPQGTRGVHAAECAECAAYAERSARAARALGASSAAQCPSSSTGSVVAAPRGAERAQDLAPRACSPRPAAWRGPRSPSCCSASSAHACAARSTEHETRAKARCTGGAARLRVPRSSKCSWRRSCRTLPRPARGATSRASRAPRRSARARPASDHRRPAATGAAGPSRSQAWELLSPGGRRRAGLPVSARSRSPEETPSALRLVPRAPRRRRGLRRLRTQPDGGLSGGSGGCLTGKRDERSRRRADRRDSGALLLLGLCRGLRGA